MSRLFVSALLASFAAGVPDVFVAALLARIPPGKVLQMIGSGILGEASYQGGSTSIRLGLLLQIAISFVIALVYNIAFAKIPDIRSHPLTFGALYGVAIFIVMNFVVVPLSRAYPKPHLDLKSVVAMTVVMIVFAEIISLIAMAVVKQT
jgi:uncharacterized membrane protein YagU involved in acid resistance